MTANKTNIWWGPPKKFSARASERKISWLELFYDLVYVAAIAQLTHHLAEHPGFKELAYTFFLFLFVFWSWMNGSLYHDLHGSEGIRTRLLTLWQMLAVASVAITIGDALEGNHQNFAISFLVVQILITYLWWSTGYYDPSHKKLNRYYLFHYSIGIILLFISIFTVFNTSIILWAVALLFNLTPGLTGAGATQKELKKRGESFNLSASVIERFGLFTIIVLGETIFGIVNGISAIEIKNSTVWIAFIIGIIIAFLLWWIYFDMIGDQTPKKGFAVMQFFLFLHIPLLASFGVIGASINNILSETITQNNAEVVWMFCFAIGIILICIGSLTRIMEIDEESKSFIEPVSRLLILISLFIFVIPFFNQYLNTLSLLLIITAILIIPVYVGTKRWVRYKLFYENNSNR